MKTALLPALASCASVLNHDVAVRWPITPDVAAQTLTLANENSGSTAAYQMARRSRVVIILITSVSRTEAL